MWIGRLKKVQIIKSKHQFFQAIGLKDFSFVQAVKFNIILQLRQTATVLSEEEGQDDFFRYPSSFTFSSSLFHNSFYMEVTTKAIIKNKSKTFVNKNR